MHGGLYTHAAGGDGCNGCYRVRGSLVQQELFSAITSPFSNYPLFVFCYLSLIFPVSKVSLCVCVCGGGGVGGGIWVYTIVIYNSFDREIIG